MICTGTEIAWFYQLIKGRIRKLCVQNITRVSDLDQKLFFALLHEDPDPLCECRSSDSEWNWYLYRILFTLSIKFLPKFSDTAAIHTSLPMFRIRNILVRILGPVRTCDYRIRILLFSSVTLKMFFLLITFRRYIYIIQVLVHYRYF